MPSLKLVGNLKKENIMFFLEYHTYFTHTAEYLDIDDSCEKTLNIPYLCIVLSAITYHSYTG